MNTESITIQKYPIGNEGNSVCLEQSLNDWFKFTTIDHYNENSVGIYLHKEELKGLAEFILKYLDNN